MGILVTRMTTATAVTANGLIPVGAVTHRCGNGLRAEGNQWIIEGSGYHKIQANVTIAPTVAGDIVLTMLDNGIPVATASAVVAGVGDAVTLPLLYVDYNRCGCASDTITISASVASSVSEVDAVIEGR